MGAVAAPESDAPAEPEPEQEMRYVGLATRVISFAIDAAVINVVATIVGVGAALILSILHLPKDLHGVLAAIAAGVYVLGLVAYFVVFWSTTGQTPGARVMRIRVVPNGGGPLKLRRALLRAIGVVAAALPLFAGYISVMYDSRRRAFPDWLARTFVIEAPGLSVAETRRAKKRAEYEAARQAPSTPGQLSSAPLNRHIVLIGMMGAGKTTVGRLLAARLGRPFWDNDEALQRATEKTAAAVQEAGGQAALHRLEDRLLRDALATSTPTVFAAAGSVVLDPEVVGSAVTVWLRASAATEAANVARSGQSHRPLPAEPTIALQQLESEREPLYRRMADVVVEVAPEPALTCERVIEALAGRADVRIPAQPVGDGRGDDRLRANRMS